jgi:AcrR family transcriptional regulator
MDKNASSTLTDFSAWLAQADPAEVAAEGAPDGSGRMYGGLTVLERRAVRRQRLLDAGLELFSRGYALATIEGICAGAGVTARHFYEEFGSREELLKAVFDRSIDTTILEIIEKVDQTAVASNDLELLVRQGTKDFIHAFLDDPRRARVVCIESVGVSPELEEHRRELVHRFSSLLQSEAERMLYAETGSPPEFVLTTRALVGGTQELIVDWLLATEPVPLDVLADVISNLYLAIFSYHPA